MKAINLLYQVIKIFIGRQLFLVIFCSKSRLFFLPSAIRSCPIALFDRLKFNRF